MHSQDIVVELWDAVASWRARGGRLWAYLASRSPSVLLDRSDNTTACRGGQRSRRLRNCSRMAEPVPDLALRVRR